MDVNAPEVFRVKNLEYLYPGKITALRQINLTVKEGEMVALVGANGSGKSTLLKLLDGLIFPSAGELYAFGKALNENILKDINFAFEFRRRVGLVFQDSDVQLFSPDVWDEVTFGPLQLNITREEAAERGSEILDLLKISHLRDRAPYRLSGGEKKKVALASVLSLKPQVLLLDEPTAGLDPWSQGNLIDFLLKWMDNSHCLIFSTQDMDVVDEIATRMIVFGPDHTIIADGDPGLYLDDPEFLVRANLIHEHSHRHKTLIHSHQHTHEHGHSHAV
jgi:cobalt/nickel transport system ATP-binding protein